MQGLLTDGQFIGAVSAQAVTSAPVVKAKHAKGKGGKHAKPRDAPVPVQTEGWKPGDTAKAGGILQKLGIKGPEPKHAKDTGGKLAGGIRNALGRVLVEGKQATASAADMAGNLVSVVADQAKAAGAALDQIVTAAAQAARDWYYGAGVEYLEWVTEDGNACAVCQANEDQGLVRLGEPFDSGDEEPPAHPHCRCVTLPAADWKLPGEAQQPQPPAGTPEPEPEPEPAGPPAPPELPGPAQPEEPGEPGNDPVGDADALAGAYEAGYQQAGRLYGGASGAQVTRAVLSDGTHAVVKQHAEQSEALHEYLAGLAGRALGIDGTGTALVGDLTTVARFAPGITGSAARQAAGEYLVGRKADELRRLVQLRNGREIGLLDWLTGQADRNGGNFMVDGDTVRPVDNSLALFTVQWAGGGGLEMLSPFSRYWLADSAGITATDDIDPAALRSPFTAAELAGHRRSLEGLEDEFGYRGARPQYQFMMGRLAMLEAIT
jgi:hypothetical protein